MKTCPVCLNEAQSRSHGTKDITLFSCDVCGDYNITYEAIIHSRSLEYEHRKRSNLSGWIRENQGASITTYLLDDLIHLSTPTFLERAEKLLIALSKDSDQLGAFLRHHDHIYQWIANSWSLNSTEVDAITRYLGEIGFIRLSSINGYPQLQITPNGWIHLDSLRKANADENQGFVAMWFDDEMQKVYKNAIAPAIINAGYEAHRVDQREHNGKIDDEIILQIRKSRFVVADFTGHRGGVYYEAGFAQGLNLEVFWTCLKEDVSKLHFDIRQYNCIVWEKNNVDEFKNRLSNRIEAVLGHGNNK